MLVEDAGDAELPFTAFSAVPQSPQKRLLGGFCAPRLGQRFVNGAPQSPQNFLPVGLSLPHLAQRINSPLAQIICHPVGVATTAVVHT
jgi:hypothetical protein